MLQPPEVQDNSILYNQIDASKKVILSQKEKIADLSNRLDTFTVIRTHYRPGWTVNLLN